MYWQEDEQLTIAARSGFDRDWPRPSTLPGGACTGHAPLSESPRTSGVDPTRVLVHHFPPQEAQARGVASVIAVPVFAEGVVCGFVDLHTSEARAFENNRHLGRAQMLAALVAYARLQIGQRSGLRTGASVSLGKALAQARYELGVTQEELAVRIGTSRIAVSRWEGGAQPPSMGVLRRWCAALGLLADGQPGLVTCVDVTPELIRLLRADPTLVHELSPETFEHLIAERLERMGYDVTLTSPTMRRDGGIDLIAVPKLRNLATFLLAGQVKHHRAGLKTGREAVDRLLSWKDSAFRLGLLVTNTSFTRDALWAATLDPNKHFLRLRSFDDVTRWLRDNFWSEEDWKELPKEVTLAPGITVRIPRVTIRDSWTIWPISGHGRTGPDGGST